MLKLTDIQHFYFGITTQITTWLTPISQLFIRLVIAKVFLMSGLSKWNGFLKFDKNQYNLFMYEFFCPDPVRPHAVQLCDPKTLDYVDGSMMVSFIHSLAISSGIMEVLFGTLLIIGLFSRLAALGLIGMTLFIQLAIFPSWEHWWNPAVWWFSALLVIFAVGPGKLSLDYFFKLERAPKA